MENSVGEVRSPDRQKTSEVVPAFEVQRTLSAILKSTPFRTNKRAQQLLQYVVDETLAGQALKERIIGANVFNRRPDYDTNADPIARLRVAEVRKRLALYYQGARDETVLINIPSGSFRAIFRANQQNYTSGAGRSAAGTRVDATIRSADNSAGGEWDRSA